MTGWRRAVVQVAAIAAIVAGSAGPSLAAGQDSSFLANSERRLLLLENRARTAAGLPVLPPDAVLVRIARWRSSDMAARGYFSHVIPPGGTTVFDELNRRHVCWRAAGENIGWNDAPEAQATADIARQFLASPAHRAIMLDRSWTAIGIGAATAPDGRHLWTMLFERACAPGSG